MLQPLRLRVVDSALSTAWGDVPPARLERSNSCPLTPTLPSLRAAEALRKPPSIIHHAAAPGGSRLALRAEPAEAHPYASTPEAYPEAYESLSLVRKGAAAREARRQPGIVSAPGALF